ncbi:MAG: branched-chain amino acid ABC transporter permease [Rhodocyclaceae bacterium]|nr:branched-chain amino acid ABC transporter permease [Rhodocyclaceae bacterium]
MQRVALITILVALLAAPALLSPWGLSQLTFVAIYIVAGAGLMLLAGYAGQLSLCHAAFIGIGAYAEAILQARGWPLFASLPAAALLAAAGGMLAAWPARRLAGIYLAIATLSFGFIVQEVFVRWESVTGGNAGLVVAPIDASTLYWLALALALGALWLLGRLLASRLGRAFIALRDDATAADVIGVATPHIKTVAFSFSAALAGLAGALYAHQLRFVSPEQFDWVMSIELLMMLVIGGLGTRAGIVLGAAFLIALPQAIGQLRDLLAWDMPPAGLELFAFGLVLVLTLRLAPAGLAGSLRSLRSQ